MLPHRAEHIGSLLRPRALKDAFGKRAANQISPGEFRQIQETCILDAIRLQEAVGLETITDGEFRRTAWSTGLLSALEGLDEKDSLFEFRDHQGHTQRWRTCYAQTQIRRARSIAGEEFSFLRAHTRATPKVTLPAPSFLHFFRAGDCFAPGSYRNLDEFWSALVAIYQDELRELAALGASYVQFDEVPLAMLCDEAIQARLRELGANPDQLIATYIEITNRIIAARPAGMTIAMHLCRGNLRSHWMASGGYDAVAEQLFNASASDAFLLEYDSQRAGDFAPLRFMPKDKFVVLGLVSSKTPDLESVDSLKARIEQATRYVAIEQLGISPQCGFASTAGGNVLSEDDQKAKLARVVEVAHSVWS